MDYLPLGINLQQRHCLVVGGGAVALRKTKRLLQAQAFVHVIAPSIEEEFRHLPSINITETGFTDELFVNSQQSYFLVVAATDQFELNAHIASLAKQKNILINVVDQSAHSDVVFPALIERDSLLVSLSTQGQSPALLRLLRYQLEGLLPKYYSSLTKLFANKRQAVKDALPSLDNQRLFWKRLWLGKTIQHLQQESFESIETMFNARLVEAAQEEKLKGSVSLVGAGPGDPELLTLKAMRLIQWADVILYDRLVSPAILEYANAQAELRYVGKQRNHHSVPQNEINQLLVDYANQGKQVVRLKGGDPFIFGRGGEEIETLSANQIKFEVVPAVSAANGCAAYAGIPLTHRDHAQSVKFLPGYSKHGECVLDWTACLNEKETLVIYMASQSIETICQQLIQHGREKSTPIALIEKGTLLEQRVHAGTLENFYIDLKEVEIQAPSLLIIGQVVDLRSQLNWFN